MGLLRTKTALKRICSYCKREIEAGEKVIRVNGVWICAKHQRSKNDQNINIIART